MPVVGDVRCVNIGHWASHNVPLPRPVAAVEVGWGRGLPGRCGAGLAVVAHEGAAGVEFAGPGALDEAARFTLEFDPGQLGIRVWLGVGGEQRLFEPRQAPKSHAKQEATLNIFCRQF